MVSSVEDLGKNGERHLILQRMLEKQQILEKLPLMHVSNLSMIDKCI
jgi:hypothetical protein